jgi:hypothetical protein
MGGSHCRQTADLGPVCIPRWDQCHIHIRTGPSPTGSAVLGVGGGAADRSEIECDSRAASSSSASRQQQGPIDHRVKAVRPYGSTAVLDLVAISASGPPTSQQNCSQAVITSQGSRAAVHTQSLDPGQAGLALQNSVNSTLSGFARRFKTVAFSRQLLLLRMTVSPKSPSSSERRAPETIQLSACLLLLAGLLPGCLAAAPRSTCWVRQGIRGEASHRTEPRFRGECAVPQRLSQEGLAESFPHRSPRTGKGGARALPTALAGCWPRRLHRGACARSWRRGWG